MLLPEKLSIWIEDWRHIHVIGTRREMWKIIELHEISFDKHLSDFQSSLTSTVKRATSVHVETGAFAVLVALDTLRKGALDTEMVLSVVVCGPSVVEDARNVGCNEGEPDCVSSLGLEETVEEGVGGDVSIDTSRTVDCTGAGNAAGFQA